MEKLYQIRKTIKITTELDTYEAGTYDVTYELQIKMVTNQHVQ